MFQSIGKLLRHLRRSLQGDTEMWLILHKDNRLFLECVMCSDGEMIMHRWVRSPARAYCFSSHQRDQIDNNKQMPEGGCWFEVGNVPLFRREYRDTEPNTKSDDRSIH